RRERDLVAARAQASGGALAVVLRPCHQQTHAVTRSLAIGDSTKAQGPLVPAKAGTQVFLLDSRLRGNERRLESELMTSHRREEIGAGALLELEAGLGAETNGIGDAALTLRLQHVAAVGLGDQATKAQPPGGDGGVARDRRATRALEHREEGA